MNSSYTNYILKTECKMFLPKINWMKCAKVKTGILKCV